VVSSLPARKDCTCGCHRTTGVLHVAPCCVETPSLTVGEERAREVLFHLKPKDACDHHFAGWRAFDDGRGGEQVCTKCGLGALAWSLSQDF
jgi:hypothetical protein